MRTWTAIALLSLACGCSKAPSPAAEQTGQAGQVEKPDPRLEVAPAAQQIPAQRLSGTRSALTGVVSSVAGQASPLQGLVDALGGEVRGNEIYIALPADTLFEFDKADVLPAAATNLRTLAELIGKTQGNVQLKGYTDAKGDDGYNLDLSKRRADAVKAWLVGNGLPDARLQSAGMGEADPVAPNETADGSDDPDGRAKNRRVEAIIPRS